jgi:hypothetical protein
VIGTKQPAAYLYSENGQIVGECMSLAPGSVVSIVEFARSSVDDETPLRTLPGYRVRGGTALRAKQLETCDRIESIQTTSTCEKSKRREKSLHSKKTHKHRKCRFESCEFGEENTEKCELAPVGRRGQQGL